jgi:hypothetical protein
VNAVHHVFDKPLQKQDRPYNRYALSGKQWTNYSMDYQYTYKNLHVFGEAAVDIKASKAVVAGGMLSLHPSVDAAFVYRNISKRYQSFWGMRLRRIPFRPMNKVCILLSLYGLLMDGG